MLVFLKAGVSEGNIAYLFLKVWIFLGFTFVLERFSSSAYKL